MPTYKVFVLGAITGGLVAWLWGKAIASHVRAQTRGVRTQASKDGYGTGRGCLTHGTQRALYPHLPSSHLVVRMPTMKTTVANTPMTAEYRSAVMLSTNTMEARSPSFT